MNTTSSATDLIVGFVFLAVCLVGYVVPTIVAIVRKHHMMTAIILVDLLLGWTFVGWIVALVMALTPPQRPQPPTPDPNSQHTWAE